MTLPLTEDQRMLQDAAQRFLADRHPPAVARGAAARSADARLALWRDIAAQGWPALLAPAASDGLGLGLNARAALITRGLAEMARLGFALGAQTETFMGLSGLGDLVLTATGDLSRNRRVGMLLAQGQTLEQSVQSLGHVAEGVYSARTVLARAASLDVDMPITAGVVELLDGRITPAQAVSALMERGATTEVHPPL